MSEYTQKIKSLEQQRNELASQVDAIGLAAADNIKEERKAVVRIDEVFDEQKLLIRNIKLIATVFLALFAVGLWYSGHYFFSILCAAGMICFDIFFAQDFNDFNSQKRQALLKDIENRMNNL